MGLRSHSLMPSSQISYYQLFPSDNNLVTAIVALLEEYEWSQVSIITEKEDLFLQVRYSMAANTNVLAFKCNHVYKAQAMLFLRHVDSLQLCHSV